VQGKQSKHWHEQKISCRSQRFNQKWQRLFWAGQELRNDCASTMIGGHWNNLNIPHSSSDAARVRIHASNAPTSHQLNWNRGSSGPLFKNCTQTPIRFFSKTLPDLMAKMWKRKQKCFWTLTFVLYFTDTTHIWRGISIYKIVGSVLFCFALRCLLVSQLLS